MVYEVSVQPTHVIPAEAGIQRHVDPGFSATKALADPIVLFGGRRNDTKVCIRVILSISEESLNLEILRRVAPQDDKNHEIRT